MLICHFISTCFYLFSFYTIESVPNLESGTNLDHVTCDSVILPNFTCQGRRKALSKFSLYACLKGVLYLITRGIPRAIFPCDLLGFRCEAHLLVREQANPHSHNSGYIIIFTKPLSPLLLLLRPGTVSMFDEHVRYERNELVNETCISGAFVMKAAMVYLLRH